jgi:chromosome segregation ATPase
MTMTNVTNSKKILASFFLGSSLLMGSAVLAETTAKEGLEKIKSNVNNSKANLGDYQKNLKSVEKNLGEIQKAKVQVDGQRKTVVTQYEENKKSLVKVATQEKELQALMVEEKNKKAQEEKKLLDLQTMMNKVQENITKRDANLLDYETQMSSIQEEKKIWASRGEQIKQQGALVDQRNRSLATSENDWRNKKKGYEGEVGRWSKEVDRQQKLQDNYTSLTEVRD